MGGEQPAQSREETSAFLQIWRNPRPARTVFSLLPLEFVRPSSGRHSTEDHPSVSDYFLRAASAQPPPSAQHPPMSLSLAGKADLVAIPALQMSRECCAADEQRVLHAPTGGLMLEDPVLSRGAQCGSLANLSLPCTLLAALGADGSHSEGLSLVKPAVERSSFPPRGLQGLGPSHLKDWGRHKKEGSPEASHGMGEPQQHHAEPKKPDTRAQTYRDSPHSKCPE